MNKFIQFITNWRNIVAIVLMGVVIASVYFKWEFFISIWWILILGSNFFFLLYKRHQRLKSES